MASINIGNSASWDGNTNNAAGIAAALGSSYASASSGALTLKNGVAINNSNSSDPFVSLGGTRIELEGGDTISSNTQGPYTVDSSKSGLFGTTITINSGVYVWSDDVDDPAILVTIPCTIDNSGYIMGKGGIGANNGGGPAIDGWTGNGQTGGAAIEINSGVSGVTITNKSGAYIAGGGGGGANGAGGGGGGGGAGGGNGGNGGTYRTGARGGAGGAIGSSGGGGYNGDGYDAAGGGAGGGGARWHGGSGSQHHIYGGGGGGRILPGSGGAGGYGAFGGANQSGGSGGSAGNAGSTNGNGAAGGGGWGANGGGLTNAGKAIDDNSVTYTLTNQGTIYGGT